MPNQKTSSKRSWTKCSTQFRFGWVFGWRLMKGDTSCAECGSAFEQHAGNAKKQWSDDTITSCTTQLEAAQEKLKTSFPGLVQTPEPSKPTFLVFPAEQEV